MSFPECKDCGWCCKYELAALDKRDPRGEQWLKESLEFHRTRSVEEVEGDDEHVFYMNQMCPQYEEGVGCKDYDNRPLICKAFPNAWNEWVEPKCKVMQDKYK